MKNFLFSNVAEADELKKLKVKDSKNCSCYKGNLAFVMVLRYLESRERLFLRRIV